jgi:autonomous glycyl radical cofactor GrcA
MAGATTATPMPDDLYNAGKAQIYVGGALYDYAAKGEKVELMGKEGTAYKIKVTSKENVESIYLIDSTSYLITSMTMKGKMQDQEVTIVSKFSDYRKTDLGYTIPYAVDLDIGGQFNLTIAVKKVELNKTIDPAVFAMPK